MAEQPVDIEPVGENAVGEAPVGEPDAVTDDTTVHDDVGLERTIGLVGGLAIGIGTMIGAGIFVFPGLAAENAGLAATASFAIGGLIALLVALPTSELATAVPRSGGGYYFISRGMVPAVGALVSFALIAFMQRASIAIGVVVMVVSYLWYLITLGASHSRGMSDHDGPTIDTRPASGARRGIGPGRDP